MTPAVRVVAFMIVGMLVVSASPQHPTAASPGAVRAADGPSLFRTHCASCHGVAARGDGPVGPFLRTPPPDLTLLAQRNKGVFPSDRVARVIDGRRIVRSHGPAEMPVWGDVFARSLVGGDEPAVDAKIRALVAWLASIQARPAE